MHGPKFNVLLYSDESQTAFFAFVYAAIVMMNMPNMHLTIVQLKESNDASINSEKNCLNGWPISPNSDWMKDISYQEVLTKTNELLSIRAVDVSYQVIYCNPNIADTVDALMDFVRKRSIELIIMGTREQRTLRGLVFGSLAHSLQDRSSVPVLLVKKLPADIIDNYRSRPILKLIQK
ncbi:universal stress protein [Desulfosporosinus sp.]|uniref:universal stress protein n=1 Tax=Desulfosporosinus sp. TaxID=157907 RepID=UPI00230BFF69|nr:universal stress protein [Desulfosporosinus sp.]MDA8223529.1 universal stress protein [Desulfitobacterium hafniense]